MLRYKISASGPKRLYFIARDSLRRPRLDRGLAFGPPRTRGSGLRRSGRGRHGLLVSPRRGQRVGVASPRNLLFRRRFGRARGRDERRLRRDREVKKKMPIVKIFSDFPFDLRILKAQYLRKIYALSSIKEQSYTLLTSI